jgi:hypothetical protein
MGQELIEEDAKAELREPESMIAKSMYTDIKPEYDTTLVELF